MGEKCSSIPHNMMFSSTEHCENNKNVNSNLKATVLLGSGRVDKKHRGKQKVPDGGYGWAVVFGCFLSHVIIGSLDRSDGIFFLEYQKRFGLNAQLTAWPGALLSGLRLCFGPLATIVCNRYSVRSACAIGSILNFTGLLLSGYAPGFYFLFLSHFLIEGVGQGLVYAPGLFLVGSYFDKKRGLAAGLGTSGVGVGTFLLVPLFQVLFEAYGYEGAFMIISAIALNLSLCAMLYRPLSLYYKFVKNKEMYSVDKRSSREGLLKADIVEVLDFNRSKPWMVNDNCKQSMNSLKWDITDGSFSNNISLNRISEVSSREKNDGFLKSSLKICFPVDTYNKTDNCDRKLFHFHLLKNSSFLLCCISILLFTAASKSAFTFIPAQVMSLGHSKSEAAMVLSMIGILDTIGRILFGFVFDLKHVKVYRLILYTLFIFLIASVSFVLPRLEDYNTMCVTCGIYGLLYGGFVSQKSVIIVDILGPGNIANSFGLLVCFQGLGMMVGPPASGALKDITGSFHLAFDLGGVLMMCAGCLMVVSNICFRRQTHKHDVEE